MSHLLNGQYAQSMGWAQETTTALAETFEGTVDHPLVLSLVAIDPEGRSAVVLGDADNDDRFEIGSITKTMTATVLAALAARGEVALDAPVGSWLDAGSNAGITLEQLATHTSGLPRLAPNTFTVEGFDEADPYATFDDAAAEAGLRDAERKEVGTVVYSNFGFQLLGLCLERATGAGLDTLLRSHVFDPLGMTSATADPGAEAIDGYSGRGAVPPRGLTLAGPGGVRASTADMQAYLDAVLHPPSGECGAAIAVATTARVDRPEGGHKGLGWSMHPQGFLWHNGGTGGFRTMLAVDRTLERGVLVMANSADVDPDSAVLLAITGSDPRQARPKPVDVEWAGHAEEVVDALLSGDFVGAQRHMPEATAAVLTAKRLEDAWSSTVAPLGELLVQTLVRVERLEGVIQAEIRLDFQEGSISIVAYLDGDRKVVGLRLVEV